MGSGYGPRQDFVERYARLEEMVRQLRIRSAQHPTKTDLAGYLYTTGSGATFEGFYATGTVNTTDTPDAFFYVDRGRCWLGGRLYYRSYRDVAGSRLIGPPLPPHVRPPVTVRLTFHIDGTGSDFRPPADQAWAEYGATIQASLTSDASLGGGGYINLEQTHNGGIVTYSGGTLYGGLPSDSALMLDGISWPVKEATP